MISRRSFLIAAATLPFAARPALALTAGQEYTVVKPALATLDPKRVEVMELFWYGCPHCYALEPELNTWVKSLPKGVYFRRVPAVFEQTPHWAPLARAYYATEALGVTEKLHYDIFNAIHLSGQNLNNRDVLLKFVGGMGVNAKKFAQALDSSAVEQKVQQAKQLSMASGAHGVPALVVDGKYQTSVTQAGSNEKLFAALNELIAQAQKEKTR